MADANLDWMTKKNRSIQMFDRCKSRSKDTTHFQSKEDKITVFSFSITQMVALEKCSLSNIQNQILKVTQHSMFQLEPKSKVSNKRIFSCKEIVTNHDHKKLTKHTHYTQI